MKRFLSNLVCVLTICAMVSFAGCGDAKKKDSKDSTKTETKKEGSSDK